MTYYRRIAVVSFVVTLLTIGSATLGPRFWTHASGASDPTPIRTSHETPNGTGVDPNTSVSMTFEVAVDHASAEQAFVIYPPVPGRFSWDEQTMTFSPSQPLQSGTMYHIVEGASVHDRQGQTNSFMTVNWSFVTR